MMQQRPTLGARCALVVQTHRFVLDGATARRVRRQLLGLCAALAGEPDGLLELALWGCADDRNVRVSLSVCLGDAPQFTSQATRRGAARAPGAAVSSARRRLAGRGHRP